MSFQWDGKTAAQLAAVPGTSLQLLRRGKMDINFHCDVAASLLALKVPYLGGRTRRQIFLKMKLDVGCIKVLDQKVVSFEVKDRIMMAIVIKDALNIWDGKGSRRYVLTGTTKPNNTKDNNGAYKWPYSILPTFLSHHPCSSA